MTAKSDTPASAGTARLLQGASAAAIFAALPGMPRIALAPDVPAAAAEPDMSSLSDAELGLGDDAATEETPEQRAAAEARSRPAEGAQEGEPGEGEAEGEPEPGADGDGDGEGEPDAEDEGEGDKEAEPEADDGVKVKLADGSEVQLGELKKGYLRQADYTRKTQALAEDNKALSAASTRLIDFDKQVKGALQLAAQVIEAYTPKSPDLSLLNQGQDGVARFMTEKEVFERGQALLHELNARLQQQGQGAQQLSEADRNDLVNRETASLIEKRPEWRDPKKRADGLKELMEVGQRDYGFSAQDLQEVTDHRAIHVLADAVAFRKLKAQRPAAISTVQRTPPMRPATRQGPAQRQQAGQASAFARARRSGSEEDVAALLTDAELGL